MSWRDGRTVFSLVSMLDHDALLERADRLRAERARETRLQARFAALPGPILDRRAFDSRIHAGLVCECSPR